MRLKWFWRLFPPRPLICGTCGSRVWECDYCADRVDTRAGKLGLMHLAFVVPERTPSWTPRCGAAKVAPDRMTQLISAITCPRCRAIWDAIPSLPTVDQVTDEAGHTAEYFTYRCGIQSTHPPHLVHAIPSLRCPGSTGPAGSSWVPPEGPVR